MPENWTWTEELLINISMDFISQSIGHRATAYENEQVFYYRRVLWQYLCDNHGYHGAYSNFCYYLSREPEFAAYFRKRLPAKSEAYIRYETPAGKQAQLDWKESLRLLTTDLGWVEVNIFVLLLSFSRYRIYRMVPTKSQDVLFFCLDDAFTVFVRCLAVCRKRL